MSKTSKPRLSEIDGLRGWAAFIVLIFHLTHETFANVRPELGNPALAGLLDGSFAVDAFFILSGDALSQSFIESSSKQIQSKIIIKRYFRLTGLIFLSSFCVYILMKMNLVFNKQASAIVHGQDWLGSFLMFEPSALEMMRYSFFGAYLEQSTKEFSYNPFLWTMQIELIGSFLVFLFGIIYKDLKNPGIFLGTIMLFLFALGKSTHFLMFFVGVFLGFIRIKGYFCYIKKQSWSNYLAFLVIGGIFLLKIYQPLPIFNRLSVHQVMVCLVVTSIYSSEIMVSAMRTRLSTWLGTISFPLYCLQFPVIVSFFSWSICTFMSPDNHGLPLCGILILTSTALTIVVSCIAASIEKQYLIFTSLFISKIVMKSRNTMQSSSIEGQSYPTPETGRAI